MTFTNPIVAGDVLIVPAITSVNYVVGVSGWSIGADGSVQFGNTGVLGNLGVTGTISGNAITVGPGGLTLMDGSLLDTDLDTIDSRLDALESPPINPGTLLAGGYLNTGSLTSGTGPFSVETALFYLDTGPAIVAGWYEINMGSILFKTSTAPSSSGFVLRYTYTTDGSLPVTPTVANALAVYFGYAHTSETNYYTSGNLNYVHYADINYRYLFLVTIVAPTPSGAVTIASQLVNLAYTFAGTLNTASYAGGSSAGITMSGSTPPAPPPPPPYVPTKHVRIDYATWSRSYNGSNATRYDDSAYCYQGYYGSSNGDQCSMVGFDYAAIATALSGATSISQNLTYTIAHAENYSGVIVRIGRHNNASKPSTFTNVAERNVDSGYASTGGTYTTPLPSVIPDGFQAGNVKGIVFGHAASTSGTYYGYLYGATQSNKPYLTTTYWK